MDSKIGFEMNLIVVEAIRGRCASFTDLTATVSEIFGGQTTPSILVVDGTHQAIIPILSGATIIFSNNVIVFYSLMFITMIVTPSD